METRHLHANYSHMSAGMHIIHQMCDKHPFYVASNELFMQLSAVTISPALMVRLDSSYAELYTITMDDYSLRRSSDTVCGASRWEL